MAESPVLYLINQQYYPEVASTGQVFQTIAEYLQQQGWTVHVITGTPFYPGQTQRSPKRELLHGVDVRRLPNTTFPKASFAGKLLNQLTFMLSLLGFVCFRMERGAVVLVTTAPPLSVVCTSLGVFFRRHRVVLTVQDLYPDVLAASGKSNPNRLGYRVLHGLMKHSMRACAHVITISTDMLRHLKYAYGLLEVELINWWCNIAETSAWRTNTKRCWRRSGCCARRNPFIFKLQVPEAITIDCVTHARRII
ncbi:MAG: glycosyltransferase [Clostridia bacterium]